MRVGVVRQRAALVLFAVVLSLWPSLNAGAASLTVSPLRLYLSPQSARGVINVHNAESAPVLVQVEAFLWSQEDGGNRLTDTRDLIVVPPVFTLPPDGDQVIRVGFRRPPDTARELSYRIILSPVPDETEAQGVAFVVRMSLPLFLTPPRAEAKPVWSVEQAEAGSLRVKLHNAGSAHVQVTRLAVLPPSEGDEPLAELSTVGYVLPGATLEWTLPLTRPLSGDSVRLEADTNLGDVQEIVPISR